MKKKLAILACICLLLTGCGKVPKLENGKDAVVSYKDGTLISVDDLYEKLKNEYALSALISMIDQHIYEIEYKDKIEDAKKDADKQLEETKKQFVDDDGNYDEDSLLSALNEVVGVSSVEAYWNLLYLNYYREFVIDSYAETLITDKQINAYYKSDIVGDIQCSHILIKPDVKDDAKADEKEKAEEAALKKAKELIKELDSAKDVKAKFAELAKENSDDSSNASDGGDLGFFNKGAMLSAFETAAYALKDGKYTASPVKTTYGYHIILRVASKEKPSLDEAKAGIITTLADKKIEEDATVQVKALTEIRKKYGVNIEDDTLNKQYDRLMNYNLQYAKSQNAS